MKDETLLPCPFCGGEAEEDGGTFVEYHGHERQDYSITCKRCGAEVRCDVGDFEGADAACSCHHNTRKICSDKWNRRALQSGNSAQPVTVPDELIHHDKDPEVTKAYKIGFNACLAVVKSATVTVPAGYVLVPVDLLSDLRDFAHPEIEKYCEMWEGRRDSEFPAMRKIISDADALISAAPQSPGSKLTPAPGWTGNGNANAALVMLDRIDTLDPADDDRIEEVKRIICHLVAPKPHDVPKAKNVIGHYHGADGKEQDIITLAAKKVKP